MPDCGGRAIAAGQRRLSMNQGRRPFIPKAMLDKLAGLFARNGFC